MVLVSVALTESTLINTNLQLDSFILPYNPTTEESVRISIRKFLKKLNEGDKLLVFADKRYDKLKYLTVLKEECDKVGIKLNISLYRKDKNHHSEYYKKWYFREMDINNLYKEYMQA